MSRPLSFKLSFLLLRIAAVLVIVGVLWLSACQTEAPPEDVAFGADIVPISLDSALAVETRTLTIFEELHSHIEEAQRHADGARPDSAAAELGRSAEMLNARSTRAEGEVRGALERAAAEGERLARALREGAPLATYALDDFTAQADVALVGFHLQRASLALDADRAPLAGQHLSAAATLYELAALYDEGVTDAQVSVHGRMRETARWLEATNPDLEGARRELNDYVRAYDALRLQLAQRTQP